MPTRSLALILLVAAVAVPGCSGGSGSSSSAPSMPGAAGSAEANVRVAIPVIEAYYADTGTYAGMSVEGLEQAYDYGLPEVVFAVANAETYCVESSVGSETYHKAGRTGEILPGACPSP